MRQHISPAGGTIVGLKLRFAEAAAIVLWRTDVHRASSPMLDKVSQDVSHPCFVILESILLRATVVGFEQAFEYASLPC